MTQTTSPVAMSRLMSLRTSLVPNDFERFWIEMAGSSTAFGAPGVSGRVGIAVTGPSRSASRAPGRGSTAGG
jgi:hypothetical protein